jgi:hypothetical protein
MNNQVIAFGETGQRLATATEYADRHGKSHRTVKRWIQEGRFAGVASQDPSGRWLLPLDAMPGDPAPEPAPQSEHFPLGVAYSPAGTEVMTTPPAPGSSALTYATAPAAPALDELRVSTAYVDVPTAARLLGIPESAVRRNADRFDGERLGAHGALVIPAATIRKVAGL